MSAKPLTGLEKAAVLLKTLSPTVSDKVVAHLPPKQAKQLMAELAIVETRPDFKEMSARVLEEAVEVLVDAKPEPVKPSPKGAPQLDVRIADTPEVAEPAKVTTDDADPVSAVAALPPELLARALENESARTIALLMNRLEVDAAGQIYKRLTPDLRKQVSLRFTDATTVNEELLKHLARAVLKKCRLLGQAGGGGGEQSEREKRIAGLLRSLERNERAETLTALEESDAALAGRIKGMLYLFEDILRMENTAIQKLLSEVDMKSLSAALYGAADDIRTRILGNLSRRAQESLKEEIELSGKVASAKVKQARQSLEEAMQRLDQRGEFVLMEGP